MGDGGCCEATDENSSCNDDDDGWPGCLHGSSAIGLRRVRVSSFVGCDYTKSVWRSKVLRVFMCEIRATSVLRQKNEDCYDAFLQVEQLSRIL